MLGMLREKSECIFQMWMYIVPTMTSVWKEKKMIGAYSPYTYPEIHIYLFFILNDLGWFYSAYISITRIKYETWCSWTRNKFCNFAIM